MVFQALYYDGRSSFGNKASIQLLGTVIKISFENETLNWNISELNLKETFFSKDKATLKYGNEFPYPMLEVTGKDFAIFFQSSYPSVKIKRTDSGLLGDAGNRTIVVIILSILGLLLLAYFVLIPAAAEMIATRIPQSYEISLGEKMFEQLDKTLQVDSEQSALANSFFHQLKIEETYPVKITVVHSDITNAYAFPGGHIVVYDKMFTIMKSKEEFAALLSHEYAHIANRHITRNLFRSLGTYFVISLVLSDVNGIMAVLLQNADNLKSLSYSRKLEQEADEKGMTLMQKAGLKDRKSVV